MFIGDSFALILYCKGQIQHTLKEDIHKLEKPNLTCLRMGYNESVIVVVRDLVVIPCRNLCLLESPIQARQQPSQ
jgi:hypothetical protein